MGWFKKFLAGRGAIPSTAKWACVQYVGYKEQFPHASDVKLLEGIIRLRYSIFPNEFAEQRLLEKIPNTRDLSDLAMNVLVVENRDNPNPFSDPEWVMLVTGTINRVIKKRGLNDVKFKQDD